MRRTLAEQVELSPLTFVLVVACVTMAVLTARGEGNAELVRLGACVPSLVAAGEPWRLLSYAVLHGGLVHLLFNVMFLLAIGPGLEERLRSPRFALLFVVGALGGSVAGCLWHDPRAPLVGASGALFACAGAALALNMRQGRHLLEFLDYVGPRSLVALIAINLVLGWALPMVSNAAHIGGLIAGFALTFWFLEPAREALPTSAGLDRAIRAGWVALLLSTTLYCVRPVARWDFLLQQMADSDHPGTRQRLEQALLEMRDETPPQLWRQRR